MSRHVLVTGGAGFIGSNFVRYLMANHPDDCISVVDSLTYAGSVDHLPDEFRDEGNGKCRFWYGDVGNADLMIELVSRADRIVHFAAETHVTRSIYDNVKFFQTDV